MDNNNNRRKIDEKPERGKPRHTKQMMTDIGKESYRVLKKVALDREEWRNISLFNQATGIGKKITLSKGNRIMLTVKYI